MPEKPYWIRVGDFGRLRISSDGSEIARVPSWFEQYWFGDRPNSLRIPPGSELILCKRLNPFGLLGYYIFVRSLDHTEQMVWNDVTGVSRRSFARIAEKIRQRYAFNVRILSQRVTAEGVVTAETEWTIESDKVNRNVALVMLPVGLSPLLGVPIRILTSNLRAIVLTGVVLWLASCAAMISIYRTQGGSREQPLSIAIPVWTLWFICVFSAGVLATGAWTQL